MIEVNHLCKTYGDRKAIDQLSFKISSGDVVGLLGPNGAGKSTTMKIITGFMAPTSGEAKVCGYDVFENPLEVKKRIGYLPEHPPVYLDMTVYEYLSFVSHLKQVPTAHKKDFIEKSLSKTQLHSVKNRLIRNLSKGFRQRVGLAQALVSNPEVLVLDEPTVGLDPKQVAEVRDLIKELKGHHTIILSTHILPEVQATCNRVIIIHQGQIVAQDHIENIEKMNHGYVSVSLKTLSEQSILPFLQKISGVISAELVSPCNYIIKMKSSHQHLDDLALAVIESKVGLVQLNPLTESLEDVFLKLTYGES